MGGRLLLRYVKKSSPRVKTYSNTAGVLIQLINTLAAALTVVFTAKLIQNICEGKILDYSFFFEHQ